jgi:uncharacterized protein
VPAFALKLLLGEMSGMLLSGQRALPVAAEEPGYRINFPQFRESLADILKA